MNGAASPVDELKSSSRDNPRTNANSFKTDWAVETETPCSLERLMSLAKSNREASACGAVSYTHLTLPTILLV